MMLLRVEYQFFDEKSQKVFCDETTTQSTISRQVLCSAESSLSLLQEIYFCLKLDTIT